MAGLRRSDAVDGYGPHSYGDAFADVYDDWYDAAEAAGDTEHAVLTLVDLAGPGPVLELGVGSGRLAVPLAERGVPTWGLDASPAMLDRLRRRQGGDRVHAVLGDMADPLAALGADPPSFTVIASAFNTFFLLAAPGAQLACLRGAAALLASDGVVVLECFVPADPPTDAARVLEPRRVAIDHVVLRESGIRLRPWMLRYLTPDQLDDLAGTAGLRLVSRWGGWDRRPFDDTSAVHLSVYGSG